MNQNGQNSKQMPVAPVTQYGNATGKPESQSVIKYGNDLRAGKGK